MQIDLVSWTVGWRFWLLVTGTVLAVGGMFMVEWGRRRRYRDPEDNASSVTPRPPPGGLIFALRHYQGLRSESESLSGDLVAGRPPENPPLASVQYEAVEYRSESARSEVQPRSLGTFATLAPAIETARRARSSFVLDSPAEAFWVVWNHHLKRAAWIAESRTPGENMIDLTSGRPEPSITDSTKTR